MLRRRLLGLALALSLTLAPTAGLAHPGVADKILDVAVVRPLGLLFALSGTGLYLGTMPLTYMTGLSEPAARFLVLAPWRYTSARVVGDFGTYQDGLDIVERDVR